VSRLRSALLSRRELHYLADAQLARDEMNSYKGWPMCATCMRPVRAYGIESETDYAIKFWASCIHQNRKVWDEKHLRKPARDIQQQAGNWLSNHVKMLVFFVRDF
jgi:hypothetical protein